MLRHPLEPSPVRLSIDTATAEATPSPELWVTTAGTLVRSEVMRRIGVDIACHFSAQGIKRIPLVNDQM